MNVKMALMGALAVAVSAAVAYLVLGFVMSGAVPQVPSATLR